jgi:hypothetical protein
VSASVDLYWLPLGAGDGTGCVRTNGRVYEAVIARLQHRPRCRLFHAALEVRLRGERFTIEMAPSWGAATAGTAHAADRGVVAEGAVGLRRLGRSRFFRYEVRRWRDGVVPDAAEAVGGARRLSRDPARAELLLALVPTFPTATWGRDELGAGEMWNSNSLVAWLLALSGHDTDAIGPPAGGRAPGWAAGLVVATRAQQGRDRSPSCEGPSALPARWRAT